MAEPQLKWGIGATDTSRAAFQSFTSNIRRTQGDLRQLGVTSDTTFRRFTQNMRESSLQVRGVASSIRGLLPLLSASVGAAFLMKALNNIGALADAAQKAGVSVGVLQKLVAAGVGTSTGRDDFVGALAKFNKMLGESELRGGGLSRFFEANGVALRDQNGQMRSTVDLFIQFGDLVKNAANEQERTVIATAALGRGGAEMIPFFMQGSEAIHKMMADSEKMGGIWSDELVAAADEVGDKWARAAHTWAQAWQGEIARIAVLFDILVTKQEDLSDAELQFQRQQILHREYGTRSEFLDPGRRARELAVVDAQIAQREAARRNLVKRDFGVFPETNITKVTEDILKSGEAETESHKGATRATDEHREAAKRLTDALRVQAEMQQQLAGKMDEFRDSAKEGLHEVFDILKDGKIELKEIGDLLTNIGQKLLNKGFDKFIDMMLGPSGSTSPGILGNIFGAASKAFDSSGPAWEKSGRGGMPATAAGPTWPIDAVTERVLGGLGGSINVPGMTDSAPNRGAAYSGVGGRKPFFDLLQARESGKSGYNSTLGNGRFTGGPQPLTGMNLGEIKELQGEMLGITSKLPKNDRFYNSSALGRYQITRRTLIGQQEKLGLGDEQLFNAGTQDAMGESLARLRGPDIAGLRKEWQGLNGVSEDKVMTAWSDQFGSSMKQITETAKTASTDFGSSFKPALDTILKSVGGAGGGGIASVFSSLGSIFSEHGFAEGGRPPRGKISRVGERGAEWFVPDEAGTIIPNDAMPSRRGSARVRMGDTAIHVHGNPDQKTLAMIDRRLSENNATQRRALTKELGAINATYTAQSGF